MNHSKVYANVDSIETMGLVDGPGIRVVIFLQGCNLRCLYCHNPETWTCEKKNLMTVEGILNKVLKYKNYIIDKGGVTFSGGEPLLQSDFIYECALALKKEGFHICIDTSGVGKDYLKLMDLVDLFIVDVKSLYPEEYKYITGKEELSQFHKFMSEIIEKNKKIWLRQVIVPGINDTEEHIKELAKFAKKIPNVEKVELLPYHTYGMKKYEELNIKYRLKDVPALSKDKEAYLNEILNSNLKK
ncbi:MAG: pyruvate formate lyase-activating protein [Bacilli bacterium]|nr:pyruvate formate lyase-activating protein [Bacilli bacterium]